MWGYGSGPHLWPQGCPVPSQDELKPLQLCPPTLFLPQTAPQILPYSLCPHTTPCPCVPPAARVLSSPEQHSAPEGCVSISANVPISLPHPTQSPIAPQGPSPITPPPATWELTEPHRPQQHCTTLTGLPLNPPIFSLRPPLPPQPSLASRTPTVSERTTITIPGSPYPTDEEPRSNPHLRMGLQLCPDAFIQERRMNERNGGTFPPDIAHRLRVGCAVPAAFCPRAVSAGMRAYGGVQRWC